MNEDSTPEFAGYSFEQALRELEETITQLENGELSLEQSLVLYERGQKLTALCSTQLEQANLRIEQLSEEGEIVQKSAEDYL